MVRRVIVMGGALDPQGSAARSIAWLWWFMLALSAVVFAIVMGALVIGVLRRRTDLADGDDDEIPPLAGPPASRSARAWLAGGGLVLPVVGVSAVLAGTIATMRAVDADREEPAVTIEVIGHQWWWEVRYLEGPGAGVVTANEIHIPVGEPVMLRLRSADVIHSFWVPQLAGKMDLLPERTNELLIDAEAAGRYDGVCAEFCGIAHAHMGLAVVADDAATFETWARAQLADAEPSPATAAGAALFTTHCATCHTVRGTDADGTDGPDLTHVSSRAEIGGGVLATSAASLHEWIADPHALKDGVLMPQPDLSDAQIDELIAYLLEGQA